MADYSKTALTNVLKVLWRELKDSSVLNPNDYPPVYRDPFGPIFSVQQSGQREQFIRPDAPYIVYDYDIVGYDTDWVICQDRLTFKIYSTTLTETIKIMNVMLDLFRRFDESAKTVNEYVKDVDPTSPFAYKYFSLTEANSPNPAAELQGELEADLAIVYSYTRDLNSEGRFA
jgi:hypothetical protein